VGALGLPCRSVHPPRNNATPPGVLRRGEERNMVALSLIIWLASAMPVAVLLGYCTLSEEL
jgi:hypothetical protein